MCNRVNCMFPYICISIRNDNLTFTSRSAPGSVAPRGGANCSGQQWRQLQDDIACACITDLVIDVTGPTSSFLWFCFTALARSLLDQSLALSTALS